MRKCADPGQEGKHLRGLYAGEVGIAQAHRNAARADPGRSEVQTFTLYTEESAQDLN
jgi:hypothetical protein